MANSKARYLHLSVVGLFGSLVVIATTVKADSPNVYIHGPKGDSKEIVQLLFDKIKFEPVKEKKGIYATHLVGSSSLPEMYVVLVKMDKDASNAPHTHPDGRATTVLRGKLLFGIGDKIDRSSAKVFEAGSFYYTPPNTPHYIVALDDDVLYQEVGMGPSASKPVN